MESELSPDTQKDFPPVPLKTYQWEDLKRAREAGGYPWTHLLKAPLEGEITAEDIIRATTPRRSMSREFSKSRTHSPVPSTDAQRILNLDSSPGSSRKHGEEGEDEGVHIPNFSKEVSLDSEDDPINQAANAYVSSKTPDYQVSGHLASPVEVPKNISPKSILKRRAPEQEYIGITETREKTKCCHPLVNKLKHLADKTLHKLDRSENEKSPLSKRKKNEETQEIRKLKNSPGAVRRQKFGAIKLGDSDEMSKTMSIETPPSRKKKEHIYEDIEESKTPDVEKSLQFSPDSKNFISDKEENNINKESDITEKKSIASQDPSLVAEDNISLQSKDHVMEQLHKKNDVSKEAVILDEEMDSEEANVDEIFQNQVNDSRPKNDSPNITITEIMDDETDNMEQSTTIPIESSPSPSPRDIERKRKDVDFQDKEWSKPSSDHEYEIIEKPPPNIIYTAPSVDEKPTMVKSEDELSSTTSLERKYLQHTSDEEEPAEDKDNQDDGKLEDISCAAVLQKDIEERFFVNTPSTVSRTDCDISTSQVDSSALENLPLKRGSRNKNGDTTESKIQQRIREGTGKLKSQAGKLKTKIQSMKSKQFTMPERPKFNMPQKPKFLTDLTDRSKISFPERPKFTLPDRRKFSLPDRPKFKKNYISDKLNMGDRKKFSFPERPKFNVPDLPKFKMPERPKINFPSLGRKKEYKVDSDLAESTSDLQDVATVEFEAKTYPRLFNRKKKSEIPKTSSSPTLNREDTPPPIFTFTRVKKTTNEYNPDSPEEPREYGNIEGDTNYESETEQRKHFETTYDFDKLSPEYADGEDQRLNLNGSHNTGSIPDMSLSKQENTHINELNNDEFFVRPKGISRENIQVREYLSDEIRQAFKIPKNVLGLVGSDAEVDNEHMYANEPDADPELMIDENDAVRYSNEDINERDDGYYTFPPVRPSRAKRKKKETESIKYIDDSVNASIQFSEVDLGIPDEQIQSEIPIKEDVQITGTTNQLDFPSPTDLHSIHEYTNDDVAQYPETLPLFSQTLPMPPKRKKKLTKKEMKHASLSDFKKVGPEDGWTPPQEQTDDIIVYRTEHEYVVPREEVVITEHSPVPPRRTRSRSSRGTSLCDDDRTSHGAESLTLDTHVLPADEMDVDREIRHESPGYATVDKGPYAPSKGIRRSKSKTPPARRRKSHSSERKYYTVGANKQAMPDRPPRKKSSTSLVTLDSSTKRSMSGDITQYVEIDEPQIEEVHKDLKSGEVVSKMKDRPLPPPPRPPRGPRRKKRSTDENDDQNKLERNFSTESAPCFMEDDTQAQDVVEIEVSTQTDPLPDDVDFELGMDDHFDISGSSSLRDIIDEDSILGKGRTKSADSSRISRATSRSERSFKFSDPKLSELSKPSIGRTSPTVILVEKRVSSPTRINEREEMLTEASLTVQPINIDESQVPDVPPLPRMRRSTGAIDSSKNVPAVRNSRVSEETAIERASEPCREVQLDNLITQRLQVKDLDVGRLNVSELQASKILVSDIEGMTLQVTELDSKSGHISVSGIEFSQSVIDEIVKKFSEISTSHQPVATKATTQQTMETSTTTEKLVSKEEETQTDTLSSPPSPPLPPSPQSPTSPPELVKVKVDSSLLAEPEAPLPSPASPRSLSIEENTVPPQRPPPPDLTPLLYSYLQDIALSSSSYQTRPVRERLSSEYHESQHQTPPPPTRRAKRKPAAPHSESSSEEGNLQPAPRRFPPPVRSHEPTITEAGAQFLRVCHNSITRTIRNVFNSFMSYISGTEDKKDVQMALVIFLVLIAGLIMFGLSDSRTIHHHHWEFFNPPDNNS